MNRLYKSTQDKVFDGVCGGIGEYFNIDPVTVRLLWIVLVIFGGTGVLAYIIAMLIIPRNPGDLSEEEVTPEKGEPIIYSQRFWGVILVVAGFLLLFGLVGPVGGIFSGLAFLMGHILWPILIIGMGFYLYFDKNNADSAGPSIKSVFPDGKILFKSKSDRRIAGVCGGIGKYFSIDSNIIRIFWAMATLGSFGLGILAYIILAVFLHESD